MPTDCCLDHRALGPVAARVRWVADDQPYDPGDTDHCEQHDTSAIGCGKCERYRDEVWDYVKQYGVYGCIVETRRPILLHPDAGVAAWDHATSLWGIVGDDEYHRDVANELLDEVIA